MIYKTNNNKELRRIVDFLKANGEEIELLLLDFKDFHTSLFPIFIRKDNRLWFYYFEEQEETIDFKTYLRLKKLKRIIDEENI